MVWLGVNESGLFGHGSSNANQTTVNRGPNFFPRTASDTITYNINDDTVSTIAGITDSSGLNFLQRRGATDKRYWKNGSQIDANAAAQFGARTTTVATIGALNFANGPFRYGSQNLRIVGAGASLTGLEAQLYTRLNWYETERALL